MPSRGSAVNFVTAGSYQRELGSQTGQQFTAGTEFSVAVVGNEIAAPVKDEMFSWVRIWSIVQSLTEAVYFEWMLVRESSAPVSIDMNSSAVVEGWQKEGRILRRGFIANPTAGQSRPAVIKEELYELKLDEGEELYLLFRPLATTTNADVAVYTILEWRQVGA